MALGDWKRPPQLPLPDSDPGNGKGAPRSAEGLTPRSGACKGSLALGGGRGCVRWPVNGQGDTSLLEKDTGVWWGSKAMSPGKRSFGKWRLGSPGWMWGVYWGVPKGTQVPGLPWSVLCGGPRVPTLPSVHCSLVPPNPTQNSHHPQSATEAELVSRQIC